MRHGILSDKCLQAFRVVQDHSKADRAAVILHVERVARYRESLSEPREYVGVVVERVREFLGVGPVAVAEPRVVRCDFRWYRSERRSNSGSNMREDEGRP